MSILIAGFLVFFLNAAGTPPPQEDDPIVLTLAGVAQGALLEAYPKCGQGEVYWDFGGNGSVAGVSEACDDGAEFYVNKDGKWVFEVGPH